MHENERLKARQHKMIEEAVRDARVKERQHLSITVEKLKVKNSELSRNLTSLTNRTIDAEKEARSAAHQTNQSTKQSKEIMAKVEFLERELMACKEQLTRQCNENIDLENKLDNALKAYTNANDAVPIKIFGKVCQGNAGNPRWLLYVWELIIEQIVNGTPPSSINNNIVSMIKIFSPTTEIRELPSIWTIRRARTVLLVVVQTLATYRIAKANKWEQLFTDGTSRRQVAFQNLIVSIEEDDLFK
jgi:hypothetical protein